MRFRLDALIKPVDPVVAVYRSSRDADASLAALRLAGYGRDMLTVVGQSDASVDVAGLQANLRGGRPHWAASGICLGLAWAVFTAVAVLLLPPGGAAFATLVTMGAIILALQTLVMAKVVAPARGTEVAATRPTARQVPRDPQAWRFLVVVNGSRSDIALARAVLAAH